MATLDDGRPRVKFHGTLCILIRVASRRYELKQRAEQQEQTRLRIVEAAIELHQTIGPRATSVSDIARRAGVGRVTVYRHFPDELSLGLACSGLYYERNPLPDPTRWETIADPSARLRAALRDTYGYHRATEAMHTQILAAGGHPVIMAPYQAHWQRAADVLLAPWKTRGTRRRRLRAAIALALSFETWRTLTRVQGLDDRQAIEVMMALAPDGAGA
jgi:AcrR family transcriptional regulator